VTRPPTFDFAKCSPVEVPIQCAPLLWKSLLDSPMRAVFTLPYIRRLLSAINWRIQMRALTLFILVSLIAIPFAAAQGAQPPPPATQTPPNDGKVRIYVTDSESWQVIGGWGTANGSGGGHESGGARPQTAEIIKTFNERCPDLTVTNNRDFAIYVVLLDHEGGKGALRVRNKIAVFNRIGDAIFSDSTRSLGNSVKDACAAINKDQAGEKK
jgi:hypothetical protein